MQCCPAPLQPPAGSLRKPAPDFLNAQTGVVEGGVDDMACLQQTELSYAWEKYMDCRLQGADLQVGAAGRH